MTKQINTSSPKEALKNIFGYSSFKGKQEVVVMQLLAGKNCLVIMPTGGGKSICYQLPSILRQGTGIIISPLIALMQDQVGSLLQSGVKAAFINSSLAPDEISTIEQQLLKQDLDILYISPERLITNRILHLLQNVPLALFAIDEAHCVSMWGHDFRPEYRKLTILQQRFPNVPRIALTATADKATRQEIQHNLEIGSDPFISSFDRPNIRYQVSEDGSSRQALLDFIKQKHPGETGIVYCLSRAGTERNAEWLQGKGLNALPYHARLSKELRKHTLERFLREEDIIVVATVAFGMGIDKPNVRFVAHLNLPKSIEAYYQETGRAGRDGLPADAWMSYGYQDILMLQRMIESSNADEQRKIVERHKLEGILGYCEVTTCRRQVLLNYFGECLTKSCGNCDICSSPVATWNGSEVAQKALSCIYRTEQRYGVLYLIDVLRAEDNLKIQERNHRELSTYGIGKELSQRQWISVFRQLIVQGFVTVDYTGFGGLKLSLTARTLLRGETTLTLRKDIEPKSWKKQKASIEPDGKDKHLWNTLKKFRYKQAEQQSIPAYFIFNDATLVDLVNKKPTQTKQLLRINGLGQAKVSKYGASLIALIKAH
ncbi:MAG: DNA helicase RecQ [Gammaproteobacteria bacterium]